MTLEGRLVDWFRSNRRDLPWRRQRTPYTTWVSEIMLQQTTVDVVVPRFVAFLRRFPDIQSLASAEEEDVVAAWSGLGYYRRARGLRLGARAVVERFGGTIPSDEKDLLSLPGVGPYTAAAIRSLAFDQPAPAIDGNVARVAARLFADDGDVGKAGTRRRLRERLVPHVPEGGAAAFSEALIELGALVCRPKSARCDACPVADLCAARLTGRVATLPVRQPPRRSRPVLSARAWVERGCRVLLVQRPADASLLPGFLELPGRWGPAGENPPDVVREVLENLGFDDVRTYEPVAEARHAITHHRIRSVAVRADVVGAAPGGCRFVPWDEVDLERVTTETRKLLRSREASV
ncbi:MAG: A/G-specific adenine glycosylase [Planctomycetes bacterium]|nr:A/G-specific adenine glycosylase [Planctomycetota bacterium]